tara:strand:+ start:152 stop:1135 length:984 start_codon:yes stop_codon:yes gene_type:complete
MATTSKQAARAKLRTDIYNERANEMRLWQDIQDSIDEEKKKREESSLIGSVIGAAVGMIFGPTAAKAGWNMGAAIGSQSGATDYEDYLLNENKKELIGKFYTSTDRVNFGKALSDLKDMDEAADISSGLGIAKGLFEIIDPIGKVTEAIKGQRAATKMVEGFEQGGLDFDMDMIKPGLLNQDIGLFERWSKDISKWQSKGFGEKIFEITVGLQDFSIKDFKESMDKYSTPGAVAENIYNLGLDPETSDTLNFKVKDIINEVLEAHEGTFASVGSIAESLENLGYGQIDVTQIEDLINRNYGSMDHYWYDPNRELDVYLDHPDYEGGE